MVGVALTNFKYSLTTVKSDCEVLDLLCVNSLKVQVKFVSSCLVGDTLEGSALQVDFYSELCWSLLPHPDFTETC